MQRISSFRGLIPLGIAGCLTAGALATDKTTFVRPDFDFAGGAEIGVGYRREVQIDRRTPSPREVAVAENNGKPLTLDPATGEIIQPRVTDHLPHGWIMTNVEGVPMNSLGEPIVNRTAGLPAWSQREVDALRSAAVEWRDAAAVARSAGANSRESEHVLGNFVAQAHIRGIDIADLITLTDSQAITPTVAESIIGTLHTYEAIRFAHAEDFGDPYTQTVHSPEMQAFVAAQGANMDDVLRVNVGGEEEGGAAGAGCYTRTAFAKGILTLSDSTVIWEADGTDDASADVPVGFPLFSFFPCLNENANLNVRVSTNGYVSFFEQGGDATDGANFTNDPIGDPVSPDGFAAPWWDDLWVSPSQGVPDRVRYSTEGEIGRRVFTVEWSSIARLNGSTTDYHWFQVKLYETSGVIEFHLDTDTVGADSIDDATQGIETYDATQGYCGHNCSNTIAWTAPTDNWRFTPARPDNDLCATAPFVFSGNTYNGDLTAADNDGSTWCGSSSTNRDVWYRFFAPGRGVLLLDTCGTHDAPGVDFGMDTVLSTHPSCPGTDANTLVCEDDWTNSGFERLSCNNDQGLPYDTYIAQRMQPASVVFIRVSHFDASLSNGLYELHVNFRPRVRGDLNCDGLVNNFDIDPFVLAISDIELYDELYADCDPMNGDMDNNGLLNNFDIDPFVACVSAGGCP